MQEVFKIMSCTYNAPFDSYDFDHRVLSEKVKAYRKYRKMSQRALAEAAGVSLSSIAKIERGEAENVTLQLVSAVGAALGVSYFDLLFDYNNDNESGNVYDRRKFQSLYPPPYFHYDVSTLLGFMLYLPLIDPATLFDALRRIDGDVVGNEEYILDLIKRIISTIPDSQARKYADSMQGTIKKLCIEPDAELLNRRERCDSGEFYEDYHKMLEDKYTAAVKLQTLRADITALFERWLDEK